MFDMLHGGASPDVPFEDLVEMGYRLLTCPKLTHHIFVAYAQIATRALREKDDAFVTEFGYAPDGSHREFMARQGWMDTAKAYNPELF